ncbi:MAG: hypothetical protein ACI837_003435 [Crocinitomicaceae bacterium]|jgi:hypothetical protein
MKKETNTTGIKKGLKTLKDMKEEKGMKTFKDAESGRYVIELGDGSSYSIGAEEIEKYRTKFAKGPKIALGDLSRFAPSKLASRDYSKLAPSKLASRNYSKLAPEPKVASGNFAKLAPDKNPDKLNNLRAKHAK